jgi:hypothetical protein
LDSSIVGRDWVGFIVGIFAIVVLAQELVLTKIGMISGAFFWLDV